MRAFALAGVGGVLAVGHGFPDPEKLQPLVTACQGLNTLTNCTAAFTGVCRTEDGERFCGHEEEDHHHGDMHHHWMNPQMRQWMHEEKTHPEMRQEMHRGMHPETHGQKNSHGPLLAKASTAAFDTKGTFWDKVKSFGAVLFGPEPAEPVGRGQPGAGMEHPGWPDPAFAEPAGHHSGGQGHGHGGQPGWHPAPGGWQPMAGGEHGDRHHRNGGSAPMGETAWPPARSMQAIGGAAAMPPVEHAWHHHGHEHTDKGHGGHRDWHHEPNGFHGKHHGVGSSTNQRLSAAGRPRHLGDCGAKKDGEKCTVAREGRCLPTGKGPVFKGQVVCKPWDAHPPEFITKPCEGKKEGDECKLPFGASKCEKRQYEELLVCRPPHGPAGAPPAPPQPLPGSAGPYTSVSSVGPAVQLQVTPPVPMPGQVPSFGGPSVWNVNKPLVGLVPPQPAAPIPGQAPHIGPSSLGPLGGQPPPPTGVPASPQHYLHFGLAAFSPVASPPVGPGQPPPHLGGMPVQGQPPQHSAPPPFAAVNGQLPLLGMHLPRFALPSVGPDGKPLPAAPVPTQPQAQPVALPFVLEQKQLPFVV